MMKKSVAIILFFLLIPLTMTFAETKQLIYDFAELLTEEEKLALEEMAHEYATKHETDFIILTTNGTDGKGIERLMGDLYDNNKLGNNRPNGNAVILSIDMDEREINISGFGKGEDYLDFNRLEVIQDEIFPYLADGHYNRAFQIYMEMADEYLLSEPAIYSEQNIFFELWFQLLISIAVGASVVGVMLYNTGGKVTTNQSTYMDTRTSRVVSSRDAYVRKTVTKRKKPSNNNKNSSGFGGSGGRMTGGGRSHSSSTRRF
ncbi:TPM domain-containing protein [Alkalihalobacterium bogoriense]|uniref:TPM domain-containing protein n=1 Tax=Alkalihalobacterium bogoriense TaxID=246272 RepID=UPI0006845CD0|nr:TPM domain-containing protein [Alkalihalobacterium bogoriense]